MNTFNPKFSAQKKVFMLCAFLFPYALIHATPTMIIPQIPLILASPIHPQVLIAIGNSQSMDGTLSGAIMTGSGSLSSALNGLNNSSSPVNYLVPAGFTPPVQAANGSGLAPYTVTQSGNLIDNGPSRLNVAKAGVQAIIQAYMQTTDFALATYATSGVSRYATWVYYMSPTNSDFLFTNTLPATPPAGIKYVTNPCYNYTASSSTVKSNCTPIATYYNTTQSINISQYLYMQLSTSSDDPNINDILYANSLPGVLLTYSGPLPPSPFPPYFNLNHYNSGVIRIGYTLSSPNVGPFATGPTNAGYVPYSKQVLYSQRGFGYYGSQSATTGTVVVPMTTAGDTPTSTSIANATNLFLPYLLPETNATSTTEIKSAAVQSPMAGLLSKANNYLTTLGSTSGGGCPQKKYLVFISDGLPTQDISGKLWPPLGSASAAGYGVTATYNTNGSLNTTNNQALTDVITQLTTLKNNGILTFVIGLGAGVDPSLNPQAAATLTAMAVAGGTGSYYPATSPAALIDDLNIILNSIQNGSFDTTAAAVSSSQLKSNTVQYQANFVSNDNPYHDWTGNLSATALDPTTGTPTGATLWSAQPLLDSLAAGSGWSTNRIIATWNPTPIPPATAASGVPFQWSNISAAQKTLLQPSDALGNSRLQYLRGNTALEQQNGGTFRRRSHILGDTVNSQALYVGAPNGPYQSTSYASFLTAQASRQAMLYMGANDGMLHAFNASTGQEAFAFIPNGVFNNLINLTFPNYNVGHLFFVDGSPHSNDVQFSDSSWHTLLVGGEGGGGNSVYALDITSPSSLTSETALSNAILWEFTDGDMGLSYSTPQIAAIGTPGASPKNFAVFFGNGYNNPNNNAVIYAMNPQTGSVLKKINLCTSVPAACNALLPQGLSSVSIGQSSGLQGAPITTVYAGDLQGNLWAVDVTDPAPSNWNARVLFQAKDSTGTIQPITTAPAVTLHPDFPRKQGLFIMFGTGQLLTNGDLSNTQTQSIYGVWDKPLANTTYSRSSLQQQTLTLISAATSGLSLPILTATSNTINWNSRVGWYDDLPTPGQRVVTQPNIVYGSFLVTLNTPPLASCGTGFSSMLLYLNFLTGGAFTTSQLSITGASNFQYNGNYAVGIGLGNGFANMPTTLGPNTNNQRVLLITQSDGTQSAVYHPNKNPRKSGWFQIK